MLTNTGRHPCAPAVSRSALTNSRTPVRSVPSPKVLLDALVENITVEGYGRRARQGRERGEASVPPFDRSASEENCNTRRTVPGMAARGRPAPAGGLSRP